MKKISAIITVLLCIVYFSACEKDDICVDGDTPLLVVGFYDITDTSETKEVTGMQVRGLIIGEDTLEVIENAALDSIAIPLRPTENTTSFLISQILSDPVDTLTNILTLTYQVQDKFVSRACGFVANYNALEATAARGSETDSLWIQDIDVLIPFVENSTEAHVKIFH
ncbi:MAG: DUF6452 family protein [Bacteroidota bacterium]